jgi:hypothetical protein
MILRIIQILAGVLLLLSFSCRAPEKADLKTYLPAGTLIYMETDDLSAIGRAFTENKDWRALSGGREGGLSFLRDKQAALAVTGFQSSGEGTVLQVKPNLVLAIDTQAAPSQAVITAERVLRELQGRFSGEIAGVEKFDRDGAQWLTATGGDGKKIFAAVLGSVALIGNNEDALKQCLEVKQGKSGDLLSNKELLQAKEERSTPGQIAFGYISLAGVRELSNYLAVSYALKSSENSLTREMISGILPEMLQKTVTSAAWSARPTASGIEDTYFVKTEREFAGTVFQTVKASAAAGTCGSKYLPKDVYSASCYRLEEPQIAWRGAVLSLAKQMDPKVLGLFEQFSRQMLKPYGIDDPELFLSAIGSEIITARFDADANKAAAIVKVKDKDKLRAAISETFDLHSVAEIRDDAELWTSRDREFVAAFVGEDLIIGNGEAVLECLRAARFENSSVAENPADLSGAGAIVSTRQKDDTAMQILSGLAARNNKTVNKTIEATSYAYTETSIESWGVKRRTVSAFGLFGEMLRQTTE